MTGALSAAERSHPMSEVRGGGQEEQLGVRGHRPRSGEAGRSHLAPKARGGSWEEPPMPKAKAGGWEGQPKDQWLCWHRRA